MLKKIKGCPISATYGHEVNACPTESLQDWNFIKLNFSNVLQWNAPMENAEFKRQSTGIKINIKPSVVDGVKKKNTKKDT